MPIEVRTASDADWPAFAHVDARNFGFAYTEADLDEVRPIIEPRRAEFREPPSQGTVRFIDLDEARTVLPAVWARDDAVLRRAGHFFGSSPLPFCQTHF